MTWRPWDELVDYFDDFLFQGSLAAERRAIILAFANSDDNGNPSPAGDLTGNSRTQRLEQTVGLILASPEFHFQ
ncbi:hypothetical protein BH23VER1_BH23VER1_18450 [soil metagenome]